MAVERHSGGGDGGGDEGDDPEVWRCKDCGAVQPGPDPPCERCWGTTFVSGHGASDATNPAAGGEATQLSNAPASGPELAATRVEHVKSASTRTTLLAAGCAALSAGASTALTSPPLLSSLLVAAAVLLGGFAVLALTVSVLAHLVDALGLAAGS